MNGVVLNLTQLITDYNNDLSAAILDMLRTYMDTNHPLGKSGVQGSRSALVDAITEILGEGRTQKLLSKLQKKH